MLLMVGLECHRGVVLHLTVCGCLPGWAGPHVLLLHLVGQSVMGMWVCLNGLTGMGMWVCLNDLTGMSLLMDLNGLGGLYLTGYGVDLLTQL